ncbi:MAG: hypothetical protein ABIS01_13370, partial [Ferruginibacter sp.]
MKTNFLPRIVHSTRSNFSLSHSSFFNKQFFSFYLAVTCLMVGIFSTKTVKAGDRGTTAAVTIVADYCVVPEKVRLTASASPDSATYAWSTGQTGSVIEVDVASTYTVVATLISNGATASASIKIADELVINGSFSDGDTGFFTEYSNVVDNAAITTELYPEGTYAIGTSGQNYHNLFYGKEHTNPAQTGNFMLVNGSTAPIGSPARQRTIWQQTVTVVPNTNYYFSAYAMNLNPGSPALLQFEVNGVRIGSIADLNIASKPSNDASVNISNWVRFYSNPTWNSGGLTTAVIRIINLNTDASGNDFGLDDISFSTLSNDITLVSVTGTDAQATCINSAITPIIYSIGSGTFGHSVTNLPAGVTALLSNDNFLTISGTPTQAGNFQYTVKILGSCNTVTATGTINIPSGSNTWSGSMDGDWSNANNWSCGVVPLAITNVIIPTGAVRMPYLTSAAVCKLLDLQAGTVLDLNGKFFTNYGGVTGTGVFKGSPLSNLTIDAAGTTSTIRFDQSAPNVTNALDNFTISGTNNSVLLNTRLALYSVLSPQNGILTINDTLVLRSTATATARVDIVTGAFAYGSLGKVEVERYFPARRAWRLVSSPLAASSAIFDSWQNKGNYEVGKGTYISGLNATNPTGLNGLDWTPLNNASLKLGSNATPVINTKTTRLSKGQADTSDNLSYFIFVRGDRNPVNYNFPNCNNTTISGAGKLQTGRQTFPANTTKGGFTLIGNPYASPVNFNKLQRVGLSKRFWAWDPYLNSEQGGYIVVDDIDNDGVYAVVPASTSNMNEILQSGQAFYVETDSTFPGASLVFNETAKSDTGYNTKAFRPASGPTQSLRVNLVTVAAGDQPLLLDGVLAQFKDGFDNGVDILDAIKAGNIKEMIALLRNGKTLSIERRPLIVNDDTLFLQLTRTTQRSYRFEFEPIALEPTLMAWLEDNYTGVKTALSTMSSSNYDFLINSDALSASANRFRIVFKQNKTGVLPVTYKSISAYRKAGNIAVEWTVENELNVTRYEVEKSIDG